MPPFRILRVLAVDLNVRAALVTDAARTVAPQPAQLTDWQKQNMAELKATGLPLGWELAPLWACQNGTTATYQKPCSGTVSPWDTVLLWLITLLGLLLGTGFVGDLDALISEGRDRMPRDGARDHAHLPRPRPGRRVCRMRW